MRVIRKLCKIKKFNPYHLVPDFKTPLEWGKLVKIVVKTNMSSTDISHLNNNKKWHWTVAMLFENAYYCVYINNLGNLITSLTSSDNVCTVQTFLDNNTYRDSFNTGNIHRGVSLGSALPGLKPCEATDYDTEDSKILLFRDVDTAEVYFRNQTQLENINFNNGFKNDEDLYSTDTMVINYDIDPTGRYVAIGYSPENDRNYNWICLIELSGGVDLGE